MTTKTEMTLENVKAGDVIKCNEDRYDYLVYGFSYKVHKDDDGLFIYDEFRRKVGLNQLSLDKFQLLSPESQAHLLTEKHSNDMAHVSEHKSAMEYLKEPSLKELSQPPVMEGKDIDAACVNSLQELDDALKLISPFGTMYISNPKIRQAIHDFHYQKTAPLQDEIKSLRYDLFHVTANEQSLQSEVEQLKGLLKEAQPFCGTMLRGKIEHYTSK